MLPGTLTIDDGAGDACAGGREPRSIVQGAYSQIRKVSSAGSICKLIHIQQ